MEYINTAKYFLREGLVIKSSVDRLRPDEPVDEVIARTVERFKELHINATVGAFGKAPDISSEITVQVVPWKERTEIGEAVEQKERERRGL
jgi:hypothetical protein